MRTRQRSVAPVPAQRERGAQDSEVTPWAPALVLDAMRADIAGNDAIATMPVVDRRHLDDVRLSPLRGHRFGMDQVFHPGHRLATYRSTCPPACIRSGARSRVGHAADGGAVAALFEADLPRQDIRQTRGELMHEQAAERQP